MRWSVDVPSAQAASMNFRYLVLCHLSIALYLSTTTAARQPRNDSLPFAPAPVDEEVDNGTFGYYPTDTYVTEDALNGPQTNFLQWDEQCNDDSLYFITPRGWGIANPGPMLLDQRGKLIWSQHYANEFGGQAYDFMVQSYKGDDYLTFWLGDDRVRGHGSGFFYMLNSSYDIVHRVGAANGMSADLHEFLITPQNTALMTMYDIVEYDLTDVPDYYLDEEQPQQTYIWDCVFQEVDIENGNLLNQWRASEHVNISTTYRGIGPGGSLHDPFDWFHMNSMQKDELGNYLISARYVHALTYIDGRTGEIIWTLGGKMNNFMDLSGGNATNFAWQHHARFQPLDIFSNMYSPPKPRPGFTTRLITMFDNAAEDQHYEWGMPLSRGLLLEITYPSGNVAEAAFPRKTFGNGEELGRNEQKVIDINGTNPDYTVRVVKSYESPESVRSSSQGSMQVLPQGNGKDPKVFIGYGLNAVWTEFEADGTVLCNAHYGATTSWERGDIQSYRTYKFPWTGTPRQPPEVEISDDDAEVYVSWNGATEVVHWILQCAERNSSDERLWDDVIKVPRDDFETAILIPEDASISSYLRIIAIDQKGRRMERGTSRAIHRGVTAADIPIINTKFIQDVSGMNALNMLLVIVFALCTGWVVCGLYRQLCKRRAGKASAGPILWR